jgi:hypothetical protein
MIRRRSASHAAAALGSQLSLKRIEHEDSQPVGEQPLTGPKAQDRWSMAAAGGHTG